ncbi:MAG: hypothetical protein OHK0046_32990 [Anaerolineae bacterium]
MMRQQSWIDHALRRSRWQPQRQVVALAALGFFIALILGALYLSQVVSEVSVNRNLADMLAERDELERVNEQLRIDIAAAKSVEELRDRAQQIGFVDVSAGQIEYLPVEGYNPRQVDTVAPITVLEEEVAVYNETFTDWLGRQWDALRRSIDAIVSGG